MCALLALASSLSAASKSGWKVVKFRAGPPAARDMRECVAGETGDATAPGFSGDGVGYVVATTSGPLAQGDGAGDGCGDGAGQATGDGGAGGTTGRAAAACSRWYAARISATLGAGAGAGEGGEARAKSVPPVAAKSNAMAGAGDSGSEEARRFGDGSSSNDTTATGRLGLGGRVRVPRCCTVGSSSPSESDAGAGAGRGAAGGGAALPRYGPAVAYCDGGSGGRPSIARQAGAPPKCAARACGDRNSRLQARHTDDEIVFAASRGGACCFAGAALLVRSLWSRILGASGSTITLGAGARPDRRGGAVGTGGSTGGATGSAASTDASGASPGKLTVGAPLYFTRAAS